VADATPDSKSEFAWIQKQFNKIGIQLIVRSTQYNRFQEKMQHGSAQIFKWGWHADYPDAENFLFLLYGPNAKAIYGGENATNYQNPQFDVLFQQMRKMLPGPERNQLITQMIHYVQEDSPWIMRFYPKAYTLSHQWLSPGKPNALSYNTLKYRQVDPTMRTHYRFAWNKPHRWPLVVFFCLILLSWIPAQIYYFHKTFWPPKLRGSLSKGL
jgi:ABC-type transport system substrate-binding protein